jgi:hypothetical protein
MYILIPTNNTFYCRLNNDKYINTLEDWLKYNDFKDIYTPFYVKRAYNKIKLYIKNYILNNTNNYIENIDTIDDVFFTDYYKYNIDCIIWFPFVKIYRCYMSLNNNTIINHIGYHKYLLKKGDIIGLDYNRDSYNFITINNDDDINNTLLRFHYIEYHYYFMYYYVLIIKYIVKWYENYIIKYHFKLYFKNINSNNIEDINNVAYINTLMFVINVYNNIELLIGFKNIILIYIIYNIKYIYNKNKYVIYDNNISCDINKFNNDLINYKNSIMSNIDLYIYTPLILINLINISNDRVSILFIIRNISIYSLHLYYLCNTIF